MKVKENDVCELSAFQWSHAVHTDRFESCLKAFSLLVVSLDTDNADSNLFRIVCKHLLNTHDNTNTITSRNFKCSK